MSARGLFAAALLASALGCGDRIRAAQGVLTASPSGLDFGTQPAGSTATLSLELTNGGRTLLRLAGITVENDSRGAFSTGPVPSTLEPGASALLSVSYLAPGVAGADTALAILASNADNAPRLAVALVAQSTVDWGGDAGLAVDSGSQDGGGAGPGGDLCGTLLENPVREATSPWRLNIQWTGSRYALNWLERDGGQASEAFLAFVDSNGQLEAGSLVDITPPPDGHTPNGVTLASGDGGFLALYMRGVSEADLLDFARLDSSGNLIPGSIVPLQSSGGVDWPSIAWDPLQNVWTVLWLDVSSVTGTYPVRIGQIDASGALNSGSLQTLDQAGLLDDLIWNGSGFAAVWSCCNGGPYRPHLVRLDEAENVQSQAVLGIDAFYGARVAWSGSEYGLLLNSICTVTRPNGCVWFQLADATGAFVGSPLPLDSVGDDEFIGIVWDGSAFAAGWDQYTWAPDGGGIASSELWVSRIDDQGVVVPGFPKRLTCAPELAEGFSMAFNGYTKVVTYARVGASTSQLVSTVWP